MLSSVMIVAVGRKAYWSEKISDGGGVRKAGYRKSRTTARSISLVSIAVTDIGRKSECCGLQNL